MATVAEIFDHAWQRHQANDLLQAEWLYRQVLQIDPRHADAWCFLGAACKAQGRLAEAETMLRQAVKLIPNHPCAQNHLGIVLAEQGKLDEAAVNFEQFIHYQPDEADAHSNLGLVYSDQGHFDEALACFDEALKRNPNHGGAHWVRSLIWLRQGDFERGWSEYEWRPTPHVASRRVLTQPRWDGIPLGGRTILLHAEQGLGDVLQFIRYAPMVKASGGKVIVECHPALVPLLRGVDGIDMVLPFDAALPPVDVQAPLLSLPGIFHTTSATIPAAVPYLHADPGLIERWHQELTSGWHALKGRGSLDHALAGRATQQGTNSRPVLVGIVWQGHTGFRGDRERSIPLAQFAPLSNLDNVELCSLQVGHGFEQIAGLAASPTPFRITDFGSRFDRTSFADAAAVVMNLDLVIAVDTAMAHLAGALGRPVWVLLPHVPDWRWQLDRSDSPWYPTMRLFRQRRAGDWEEVMQRVATALECGDLSPLSRDRTLQRR